MWNGNAIEGPKEPFAINKVEKGLGVMKNGKATRLTGIVKKYLIVFSHEKQVI